MNSPAPICIVNASAGAGKTTDLGLRLCHLLTHPDPENRKGILALTFTNAAANEMYSRVFEYLCECIHTTNETDSLIRSLKEKLRVQDSDQLKEIVYSILRSPSMLSISTFDSFFLRVIKSFPLEMEISPNYQIADDQTMVTLTEDFDQYFWNIILETELLKAVQPFRGLTFHFGYYANHMVPALRKDLISLEDYLTQTGWAFGIEDCSQYLQAKGPEVLDIEKDFDQKIHAFSDCIEKNLDFFSEGRRRQVEKSHLSKLKEFGTTYCYADIALFAKETLLGRGWYGKCAEAHPELEEIFQEIKELRSEIVSKYLQLKQVLFLCVGKSYIKEWKEFVLSRNLITFQLLNEQIYQVSQQFKEEAPDDSHLSIHDLYYHLDGQIKHFLFDEFQDTNAYQWDFFEPLLAELIANQDERSFYYVGDPKQSLYRFRGATPELFTTLSDSISEYLGKNIQQTLEYNYRSNAILIRFFNDLFGTWPAHTDNGFQYEPQKSPKEKEPLPVTMQTIENTKAYRIEIIQQIIQDEEDTDNPDLLKQIVHKMQILIDQYGYQYQDFAVLSYRKKELNIIAHELGKYDMPYLIEDNPPFENFSSYHIVRNMLGYFITQDRRHLFECYYYYHYNDQTQTLPSIWSEFQARFGMCSREELIELLQIPHFSEFINSWKKKIDQVHIDLLIKKIIQTFGLFERARDRSDENSADSISSEQAFLLDLQEFAYQYVQNNGNQLSRFLAFLSKHADTITTKGRQVENQIRLYTVHKSKGLQFPIVFYYYLPRKLRLPSSDLMIVPNYLADAIEQPTLENFPNLQQAQALYFHSSLPFYGKIHEKEDELEYRLSFKANEDSSEYRGLPVFFHRYLKEQMLEEYNKFYVACTRAKESLIIINGEQKKKNNGPLNIITQYLTFGTSYSDHPEADRIVLPEEIAVNTKTRKAAHTPPEPVKNVRILEDYPIDTEPLQTRVPDNRDTIAGKGLHRLLEYADFQDGQFDFSMGLKRIEFEFKAFMDPSDWEDLIQWTNLINQQEKILKLYTYAQHIHKEACFVFQGQNHFIDCYLECDDRIIIIDYKYTAEPLSSPSKASDRAHYRKQLQRYERVLSNYKNLQGKKFERYLLNFVRETGSIELMSL